MPPHDPEPTPSFHGFPEAGRIPAIVPCMTENSCMSDINRIKEDPKRELWPSLVISIGMPPSLKVEAKALPSTPATPSALPAQEAGKFDDGGQLRRVEVFRHGAEIGTGCADMVEIRGRPIR
jgi:hypothetical protein